MRRQGWWSLRVAAGLAASVLAGAGAAEAGAMAGALDPSFSSDGKLALASAGAFVARAVAVQADGRIVVAGYSCAPVSKDATCLTDGDSSFRVARFTGDGGLDPEFGDGGIVTTAVGTGRSQALDLVLPAGGGVIAGGVARDAVGRDVFALVGYDARGALNQFFGTGGTVLQPIGTGFAAIADLAAGPNGTIIAAGQAHDAADAPRLAVARFTPEGALDRGFATGGSLLAGFPYGYGLGVDVDAAGNVIAAGIAGDSSDPTTFRFGELRLSANGLLDPAFGASGMAEQRVGSSSSFANAVDVLPDGRWLAGGAATASDNRQAMALVRGLANGAPDPTFAGGSLLLPIGDGAVANDVMVIPDGRVLAVGQAAVGGSFLFATARLFANGAPDYTFGAAGVATVSWDRYPVARATAGALDAGGRLVTAGLGCAADGTGPRCEGGTAILMMARQLADPPTVPSPRPTPIVVPRPTPAPDTTAPSLRISRLPVGVRRSALVRRGAPLRVRSSEPARFTVRLLGRRRGGRRTVLVRMTRSRLERGFTVRLRPRRRAVRAIRAQALRLEVRATDAAGNTARVRRVVQLR